ncbi:MAG: DUF6169 family protein [Chitinophagaceae bacterium]
MLNPYPLQEADKFSYQFITDAGIVYHVYFLDYSYMFGDYPELSGNVYSFNIDVGDTDNSGADERVGLTVVEVFRIFFSRLENVTVYVCDSSDERHLTRKRKFDFWFWKYNDGSIIKEDGVAIVENMEILNSLLVHRNNPNCAKIIFAFKDLNARAGEK